MAKQLKEWLDEFIDNGFDSKNITHWPEEGSEPVVVEELPEEPVFGKVYAMEDGGETTYYTTDVNGDWINLTEGGQAGGIVDVEYLSEATEPNVTYNVTVGDEDYGPGLYYSIMDKNPGSDYLLFISLNGINYDYINNDSDGHIVLSPDYDYIGGEAIFSCYDGDMAFINIDGSGNLSSDRYYPYNYTESSGVTDILDAIYPYSAQKNGAFYLSSGGKFNTPSDETALLIQQGDSENGYYYDPAFISSGEEVIVYHNGDSIQYSSGANEIYWKYYSSNGTYDFYSLQNQDDIPGMLTDVFGSHGSFSSGGIYYPEDSGCQYYYCSTNPFIALISTHATAYDDSSGYTSDLMYQPYDMEPGKVYTVQLDEYSSDQEYILKEVEAPNYFETENAALQALQNSVQHEVSSGDVFQSIYYPYYSSGRHYNKIGNEPYGYWFRGDLNNYSLSADGDQVYCYTPQRLWDEDNHRQALSEDDICNFLNVAKAGQDNSYNYHDEYAGDFWSNANKIYYPDYYEYPGGYKSVSWTENTGLIYIVGKDNQWSGCYPQWTTMDNSHFYYQHLVEAGSATVTWIDSVALPVDSTPVQVTIDGVSYTITKNE